MTDFWAHNPDFWSSPNHKVQNCDQKMDQIPLYTVFTTYTVFDQKERYIEFRDAGDELYKGDYERVF